MPCPRFPTQTVESVCVESGFRNACKPTWAVLAEGPVRRRPPMSMRCVTACELLNISECHWSKGTCELDSLLLRLSPTLACPCPSPGWVLCIVVKLCRLRVPIDQKRIASSVFTGLCFRALPLGISPQHTSGASGSNRGQTIGPL